MRADTFSSPIVVPPQRALQTHRSIVDQLARPSVFALLGRITRGSITIVDGDERFVFGPPAAPLAITIHVVDPSLYRSVLFDGSLGAGEAYMKGFWTCDDLPGLARILARNIDTLDAMSFDRPYRKALPFDVAKTEIVRMSGSQFDPLAVDIFLKEEEELRGLESLAFPVA